MERPAAIITGASSGIGRETAVLLAERGMQVVLVGRRREQLEQTAGRLSGEGHLVHPADLRDRASVGALIGRVREAIGRTDVVVNNAGIARLAPLADGVIEADIIEHVELNAIAPAMLIAAAWPLLIRQPGACIVNVSSMATVDPFPGFFTYALSKAPLDVMLKSCAKEGAPNVRAFGIAPGCVETPLLRTLFDEQQVPPTMAITARDAATLIAECIDGHWDSDNGKVISILMEGDQVVRRVVKG